MDTAKFGKPVSTEYGWLDKPMQISDSWAFCAPGSVSTIRDALADVVTLMPSSARKELLCVPLEIASNMKKLGYANRDILDFVGHLRVIFCLGGEDDCTQLLKDTYDISLKSSSKQEFRDKYWGIECAFTIKGQGLRVQREQLLRKE